MKLKIILITLIISIQFSCIPSYSKKKAAFNKAFEQEHYIEAENLLIKNKSEANSKTKLLYFLNKGVVEHYLKKYDDSNKSFEEAYRISDEFVSNVFSDTVTSLLNPNLSQYNGEIHEILLIHYFKALNYLFLNDLENALVECRRLDIKLKILQDKFDGNSTFSEDAFMHLLMGIIYQANEEYNNAFIAYRNSLNVYENVYISLFNHGAPHQLIKDLIYCACLSGFKEEVDFYKHKYNMQDYAPEKDRAMKDLVFIWHNGLGPIKEKNQIDFIILPGVGGIFHFNNEELGLAFSFPLPAGDVDIADMKFVRLVFPKYVERETKYKNGYVQIDNQNFKFELCENINAISFQILKERMAWEIGKSLLRVAIKQFAIYKIQKSNAFLGLAANIVGYVTEDADTRNWQTLPHSIFYSRVKVNKMPKSSKFISFLTQHGKDEKEIDLTNHEHLNTAFIEIVTT